MRKDVKKEGSILALSCHLSNYKISHYLSLFLLNSRRRKKITRATKENLEKIPTIPSKIQCSSLLCP